MRLELEHIGLYIRLFLRLFSSQIFFHAKIELKKYIKYGKIRQSINKKKIKIRKQAYLFLDKLIRRHRVWSDGSQTMDRTKTLNHDEKETKQRKNTAKKKFHRR